MSFQILAIVEDLVAIFSLTLKSFSLFMNTFDMSFHVLTVVEGLLAIVSVTLERFIPFVNVFDMSLHIHFVVEGCSANRTGHSVLSAMGLANVDL